MINGHSVAVDLKEKNIDINGPEFYAVVKAYVAKIKALQGESQIAENDENLFELACQFDYSKSAEDMENLIQKFTDLTMSVDADTYKMLCVEGDRETRLNALHNHAVSIGEKRDYNESFANAKKFGRRDEVLEERSATYKENLATYLTLMRLMRNDDALEQFIKKRSGDAKTPLEQVKTLAIDNMKNLTKEFLDFQENYIEKVVSLIVDNACRLKKTQDIESLSLGAQEDSAAQA